MCDEDRASRLLGIDMLDVGKASARLHMTMTASMINSPGMAHGGYIFLLAESVFAHACNSHGPVAVASGADLTFVAPPMTGMSSRRPPRSARLGSRTIRGRRGIRPHQPVRSRLCQAHGGF
ncbi:hotdog fold thioesterase [Streptomyces sp. NPDC056669]|uniref:hotdog fold thioesterase n=1 Tax=Streptomyces sp. NPDC056669 TaxID=3345903 RepID=UPI0036B1DC33